jgi:hypothetical protein
MALIVKVGGIHPGVMAKFPTWPHSIKVAKSSPSFLIGIYHFSPLHLIADTCGEVWHKNGRRVLLRMMSNNENSTILCLFLSFFPGNLGGQIKLLRAAGQE